MIDDTRQDLASAYVLNALNASEARAFEAELARDPELRALTDELTLVIALSALFLRSYFRKEHGGG